MWPNVLREINFKMVYETWVRTDIGNPSEMGCFKELYLRTNTYFIAGSEFAGTFTFVLQLLNIWILFDWVYFWEPVPSQIGHKSGTDHVVA